ncbi:MAG TPA: YXWGXW repeat-containing protein [Polyangiaceae bacterium]|nr:YXWGXW repeat-containing protein [Polyangiaceae bacterium]
MVWRLAVFGCVLAACSGRVPHPPYASQPTSALVEVDYPPPPARVEFLTTRPASDAVWLNGEWSWTGRRWAWKPGGWVKVPEGGAYAKLTLARRSDGKLFSAPGTWRNAKGEEIAAPEIISASPSKASAVVDPEGDPAPTAADLRTDGGAEAGVRAPDERRDEERSKPKEEERTP